jgi:septum site-determining protein MinC
MTSESRPSPENQSAIAQTAAIPTDALTDTLTSDTPTTDATPSVASATASTRLPQPATQNLGLPQVGDLSKLAQDPVPALELSALERRADVNATPIGASLIDQINAAPTPTVPPVALNFAVSQAIPADTIPAALAAKEAAAKAAGSEGETNSAATPSATPSDPTAAEPIAMAAAEATPAIPASPLVEGHHAPQVRFKNEQGKLLLILPSETNDSSGQNTLTYAWSEVMNQLRQRLQAEARHWAANTAVHLIGRDRLLSAQQLQDIVDALATHKLQLRRVYTSRRQTATTAATAGYSVEQHVAVSQLNPAPAEAGTAMAEPLVLKTTLRSGVEIRHNGTVVILGDLNPGSAIVAEGDIVVWGRLRGNVHAGYKGDTQARIMALRMEPAQIRIAGFVARGPSNPPTQFFPEVAYVTPQGAISIARMEDMRDTPAATTPTRAAGPTGRKFPATGKRNF